jgi:hypothetical protein
MKALQKIYSFEKIIIDFRKGIEDICIFAMLSDGDSMILCILYVASQVKL